MNLKGRFHGCLLGLAVGDAVGTTLEFKSPGSFKPISDMVGGGPLKARRFSLAKASSRRTQYRNHRAG